MPAGTELPGGPPPPRGVAGCRAVRRACAVKCWLGAPWRPAVPRRGTPRKFWRSCWAGEGIWAYQEGQMGRKMVRFAALSGTRSRQDESIEVGEVGSKRPSLGCNGVHVVRCSGLIFWLLMLMIAMSERYLQEMQRRSPTTLPLRSQRLQEMQAR